MPVPVRVLRGDGRVLALSTVAAVETTLEVALMRAGSFMPFTLRRCLAPSGHALT